MRFELEGMGGRSEVRREMSAPPAANAEPYTPKLLTRLIDVAPMSSVREGSKGGARYVAVGDNLAPLRLAKKYRSVTNV